MTPPVLPGEVWRGVVTGLPVCVTMTDGTSSAWWWDGRAGEEVWWRATSMDSAIFAACIDSLRTDAQRAADVAADHEALALRGCSDVAHEQVKRAAEDMRERCAKAAEQAAYRGGHGDDIPRAIRALPIPANDPACAAGCGRPVAAVGLRYCSASCNPACAPCSCPDRITADTPYPDHRGQWSMDVHVERAWAKAHDLWVTWNPTDHADYPVNAPVIGCPWCARPLPDGVAERARLDAVREAAEAAHTPGCVRKLSEGLGHPGKCRETP